ncbi:MAG TPA: M14 family metallopeptidase, partial [Acidobacteriota bacterium]
MRVFIFVSISILLFSTLLAADETPVLSRINKSFDSSIPTIKSILGYDFGEQITRHRDMELYLDALAKASPQIKIETIGKTYEGRNLYYAIVSSADNMARLEEFRQANLKLADPRLTSTSEARQIIENNPVFVELSYSIHGNEHSGVEAGLAILYYFLASTDEETKTILQNCILIVDPMQNPDGRERFINYFYTTAGKNPNPDPNAAEHNEVWPSGRTNHYLFDMNRDWTTLSQIETRARVKAYQRYQPQYFIDLHEMGENSTYFFPPPTAPQNPNIAKSTPGWWQKLGKAVATEFDKYGVEYYTQEGFDFWYPGYGDSWPNYNGAISGTFEQGSVRGLITRRSDKTIVSYKDAVWHHFLSSLATCKLASSTRKEKLQDFYDFRSSAIQEGKTGGVREFIIRRSTDPAQTDRAIQMLLWHGIEVKQIQSAFQATVNDYFHNDPQSIDFQSGDYIISLDQPLKRLIQVTFEKESTFDKKFLEEEAKRREEKEPTEFYDITAWSMPLAFGLDAYWSPTQISATTQQITSVPVNSNSVADSTYAYLMDYRSNQDLLTVLQLLKRDVRIYFTTKPITLNSRTYRAGSFIIKVKDNVANLKTILGEVSQNTGAAFVATSTGWTEEGPDLGSGDVNFLEKPKVLVLNNAPTDTSSYGEINYLFDQRYDFEFTPVPAFYLKYVNLKDYNVLILPDEGGYFGGYDSVLGKSGVQQIKNWVQSGGTLIAIQGAAAFLCENGELTDVKRIKKYIKDSVEAVEEKTSDNKESEKDEKEKKATESPDYVLGSIARAALYKKHFLTFGYGT